MERQLDQSCLTPEEAYVRSKDLLEKGISEEIAMRDKVKYYQSKGLFISMVLAPGDFNHFGPGYFSQSPTF